MAEPKKAASPASSHRSSWEGGTKTHATVDARRERMASALDVHLTSAKDAATAADIVAVASPQGGDSMLQSGRRMQSKEIISTRSISSSASSAVNKAKVDRSLGLDGSYTEGVPQIYRYEVPTFRTSTQGLSDSSENFSGSVAGSCSADSSGGSGDRRGGRGRGGRSMNTNMQGGGGSVRNMPSGNSKKGIDPPEVEVPLNVLFTEKLARKSRSMFMKPSSARQPSPPHTFTRGSFSSMNCSKSSIHEKGGSSGRISHRTGSSFRQENLIDAETDDDSDDGNYPIMSTDPVQSDEDKDSIESDEEPLTDHFDVDDPPPRRKLSVTKKNHPRQYRRYASPPIQGKTSDDLQHQNMKQHPSSAPQRPIHRPQPQKLIEFLHAVNGGDGRGSLFGRQQGHFESSAAGDEGGKGFGENLQLPFSSNISQNPNPNSQQQHHHDHPFPHHRQGKHSQHNTHNQEQPIQSKSRPRRMSDEAIHHLYTNGIDLLKKAANEARQREEVDSLNNGINYLKKNLEMSSLEKGGNSPQSNSEAERCSHHKAAPLLSVQSTRLNPPPPKRDKSDSITSMDLSVTVSNCLEEGKEKVAINDSYTYQQQRQQQQLGVHRPPPPRTQSCNPSTPPTQTGKRPVITAAAAMDYIMSASARPPSVHDDAKNVNCNHDEIDDEVGETCNDQDTLDVTKMKKYLNVMIGVAGIEEGAANIATIHEKNAWLKPIRKTKTSSHNSAHKDAIGSYHMTEEYFYDFERNISLSLHGEPKFCSPPGQLSEHVEDKHRVRGEQRQRSITSVDPPGADKVDDDVDIHKEQQRQRSFIYVDPPDADEGDDDVEIHNNKQLPPRNMNERLSDVASVYREEVAKEAHVFDQATLPRLVLNNEIASDGGDNEKSHASGPQSQRHCGTMGVIIDAVSLSDDDRNFDDQTKMKRTIQMESSFMNVPNSDDQRNSVSEDHLDEGSHGESIKQSLSKTLSCEGVNEKSTALMMKLCSHLLPAGIDAFDHQNDNLLGTQLILNKINLEWDNDDPDEPGYIVHRLTNAELIGVESAFEKLVTSLKRKSEKHVRDGFNDKNFERDLEEAELILDQEERRYESEVKHGDDISKTSKNVVVESQFKRQDNEAVREFVPEFPGTYPSRKGIAGEMDCFYLPIITKSQKTGFEPTKDLVLKPGCVFANNYLVQSELGSAAFSTAYRCLDLSSEEDEDGYQDEVCLKVIKNTKDYFDQSLDEIKILQLLKDTGKVKENNIVEMKSFFYHREHLVIVTELLRQNLYEFGKSILESGGSLYFTRLRLSHITRQCLIALKFVHELGLMHCDIKPENILLCSYSRALIKIIDFGSSSFVSDRQSSYIQSRSYRAPEVILGLPYDGKIDMWSLGCVVAEMYTNEVTFQNDSEISMLSRIEAICGPFPRHMVAKGRNSHRIFTDSGLIYEKISSDEGEEEEERSNDSSDDDTEKTLFRVYQPKMTTIAARLGFDEDLMDHPRLSDDDKNRAQFVDFVSKLLTINPDVRLSAAEALNHPWIRSSLELTEDDINYSQG
ncbi:hypothetical protein ACHAXA_004357 [Cyclostephanos tholiformis]|uniref:Protein kinase domain-containing protein n=1 Tax=Cyclostephanos tholiformis TaxID=382380 RepID=A0ABD3SPK3_9STRA